MAETCRRFCRFALGLLILSAIPCSSAAAQGEEKKLAFFERRIRPVLVKHCYECHSADSAEVKGGLLVDSREGLARGSDSGPAVVAGHPEDSIILEALRYESVEMPPSGQLPDEVVADFERWVRMGAPDPRDAKSNVVRRTIDLEEGKKYWAFQPIAKPSLPVSVSKSDRVDHLIVHRLDKSGVELNPLATPAERVRRLYFDLVGLPPGVEDVKRFEADPSVVNWRQLVNRLLDSPRFGERWGRHWLDVARYGESTGMDRNFTYPHAWRYRDYVIEAFNADKPFDEFIREQIAGDLLEAESPSHRLEQLVATGFLSLGTKSLNERNLEQFRMDIVDDQIDVTTRAFLGLTVSCARCHDHKFDPIPTSDYYAMAGIFRSTETLYGTIGSNGNRQPGKLLKVEENRESAVKVANGGGKATQLKKLQQQLAAAKRRLKQLETRSKGQVTAAVKKGRVQVRSLEDRIAETRPRKSDASAGPIAYVMAVVDRTEVGDTEIRVRGEVSDRGDQVPRGVLSVMTPPTHPEFSSDHSGRQQLAEWITSEQNSLTARVAVNRAWQHLFGRGIVPTVNNFGRTGERPSHPELLDYLAATFVENGWSTKSLIREIVLSHAYQASSSEQPEGLQHDPANSLYWRMNIKRLEAEAIRDAILSCSGQLNLTPPEKSVVDEVGDGNVGRQLSTSRFNTTVMHQSVYLPIVRGAVPELMPRGS